MADTVVRTAGSRGVAVLTAEGVTHSPAALPSVPLAKVGRNEISPQHKLCTSLYSLAGIAVQIPPRSAFDSGSFAEVLFENKTGRVGLTWV